jgi:hypothetical protein
MPSKLLLTENKLYLITKHNTTAKFADFRLYLINWQFFLIMPSIVMNLIIEILYDRKESER